MPPSNPENRHPIIIVGAPRSGTTLLRYMISSHPRIYIPPESNFMLRFFRHPPEQPMNSASAVALMKDILDYHVFFRDWQGPLPDPDAFVARLPDLTPTTILATLFEEYARQHDAERWGDKSPIYASHLDEIAKLIPGAQFIHIIRDGRDVALSMMKAYRDPRFFYIDLGYAALSWKQRLVAARRSGVKLGTDRYIEIRFEALTADPTESMEQVCEFLEEQFSIEMIHPHKIASEQYHSRGIHAATRLPPFQARAGHWRTELDPSDQKLFQALAGDLLLDLGYEVPDLGELGRRDRVRLMRMMGKYTLVEGSRRLLRAAGILHPASLLSRR